MEYHFIKLNVNGTYLSLVDPSHKSRFICFRDKPTAGKCVEYVSSFRARHGVWPSFDMTQRKKKIESSSAKLRTPEQVMRYLEVDTYDLDTVDRIAARTNTSFYCVLRFDSVTNNNIEALDMSGQEMDAIVDEAAYRDLLEYKLKCE
jgi:hypothetical protein|tara:strand:- start:8514 stop:8954 length:441 start_codon:yes stop_codon:yes gene_type:complete